MKRFQVVGLLVTLLVQVDASASGAYIGGALGSMQATLNEREEGLANRVANDLAQGGTASYSLTQWSWGAKLYGGYWFDERYGVEAQFLQTGALDSSLEFARDDLYGTISAQSKDTLQTQVFALTATGVIPTEGPVGLIARAGLARWRAALEVSRECVDSGTTGRCAVFLAQDGKHTAYGTGVTYGLGLMVRWNVELSARFDWDRYNNVGGDETGGKTDINTLMFGVDYTFGEAPLRRPARSYIATQRLYYGAGLSFNTLANTKWGTGAQALVGYDTGIRYARLAVDAEIGFLNTGDMNFEHPKGARVATRAIGPWATALGRVLLENNWELLGRIGADFGDDSGVLIGVGAGNALMQDVWLRLEYVVRENVDAVQLNLVYRPLTF